MFQHFNKLWGADSKPEPAPSPTNVDAVPPDDESEELDVLYRQALSAMDVVESGVESASAELPAEREANADLSAMPRAVVEDESTESGPHVAPTQVLEAALFVGGIDLTLKRLCNLLRDEFPPESVEAFIDEIKDVYREESRPYEITFGEGGYRMTLLSEYDDVRNRVFGKGPREFKLKQDALEVLSLVAYQQPIDGDRIVEIRGDGSRPILRQLLRRQLIELQRVDEKSKDVHYRTSPRFLEAFGLATLDDLPQSEDLAFK